MNIRRITGNTGVAAALVLTCAMLGACTEKPGAATPRITEKTFRLRPATVPVRVGVLTGELADLSVTERVNAKTGAIIYAPELRGTLRLKNGSSSEAVRILEGELQFLDASGTRIGTPDDDGTLRLHLYSTASERLDPGKEITQSLSVPFPASALNAKTLAEIRLGLTYLPTPYRHESVDVPVVVADHR
jgi:hypothetical protein